jgi:hypothetical protein
MTAQHTGPASALATDRSRGRRLATAVAGAAGLALAVCAIVPVAATAAARPASKAAAQVNCAKAPGECGYPDAANTGVPAGMTLRTVPGQVSSGPGWHFDRHGWVRVTGNGAVLSGLYIPYNLDVTASNVTIKDDRIVSKGRSSVGVSLRHTAGVTIEHSTISGFNARAGRIMTGIKDIHGNSRGTRVLRDNISLAETGVQMESGLVRGTYIHNTGFTAGDHVNGITSNGGTTRLLIVRHNTILINRGQTDAVGLFEDFGIQANRDITGNLLAGGSYPIYGGQTGTQATRNIKITGNRISTLYYAKGGKDGTVAYFNPAGAGNTWTGNIWDSTGQNIPAS